MFSFLDSQRTVASQSIALLGKETSFDFVIPLFLKLICPQNLIFLTPFIPVNTSQNQVHGMHFGK